MRGQGRVYQRGTVFWIAYYHRGRQIRESSKGFVYKKDGTKSDGTDQRAAEKLLKERLRTAGTVRFIGPAAERLDFDDLAGMYLTDYRVNGRRSVKHAERNIEKLRTVFGLDHALDITADRIAAHTAARLADSAKPATVNRELAALRRMFSLAVKAGKLPSRPHIAMLAEDNAREGFLEPAGFEAVRTHLPPYLADAATFAYLSGWRKSEVRTLEWRDIDLAGGVIRLRAEHSKNKRGRVLVLRGELLHLIRQRAEQRRLDCPHVFHRDGKPLGNFRKAWRKACETAGFTGQHFHDMRRSAVRNLVRSGVPERVAMAISGHKTRSVFDRYNIVSEADLADAAERVSDYVGKRREEPAPVVAIASAREERAQNTHNETLAANSTEV